MIVKITLILWVRLLRVKTLFPIFNKERKDSATTKRIEARVSLRKLFCSIQDICGQLESRSLGGLFASGLLLLYKMYFNIF